jgi:hypothetical protein
VTPWHYASHVQDSSPDDDDDDDDGKHNSIPATAKTLARV